MTIIIPTVADVRAEIARVHKKYGPCADDCPGWVVAHSDGRGLEIERCDDCIAGKCDLFDEDLALLPEAQEALARTAAAPAKGGDDDGLNPPERHVDGAPMKAPADGCLANGDV